MTAMTFRSLILAAFLLFALLYTTTAVAVTGRAKGTPQSPDIAIAIAVTSTGVITVTTTDDEVNIDGDCSLREAIQAAAVDAVVDACPAGKGGDVIVVPQGHYVLALDQLEISGTVTISGSTAGLSIIDGQQQQRVLYIDPNSTVNLLYLDIRNGQGPGGGCCSTDDIGMGGGIANYGFTSIADSTIHDNSAGFYAPTPYGRAWDPGGGIYNEGRLSITNSVISNNAAGSGGGIHNRGNITITNSTIASNHSGNTGFTIGGGGIYNEGTLVISYSTISSNVGANSLCAFYVHENSAYCLPGGAGGGITNSGVLTIFNSTMSANRPGDGACLQIDEGELKCGYGEIYGEGGAIFNSGALRIENSTIAKNFRSKVILVSQPKPPSAASERINIGEIISYGVAGGLYVDGGVVTLKNDIIADNEGSGCAGVVNSLGYNIIQATSDCTIQGSYLPWGAHLGPLQDNGGPTLTHALDKGSPAVDTGTCTMSTGVKVKVDQRGEPRPQGDGCDIGAYESPFTSTFAISNTVLPLIGH